MTTKEDIERARLHLTTLHDPWNEVYVIPPAVYDAYVKEFGPLPEKYVRMAKLDLGPAWPHAMEGIEEGD